MEITFSFPVGLVVPMPTLPPEPSRYSAEAGAPKLPGESKRLRSMLSSDWRVAKKSTRPLVLEDMLLVAAIIILTAVPEPTAAFWMAKGTVSCVSLVETTCNLLSDGFVVPTPTLPVLMNEFSAAVPAR